MGTDFALACGDCLEFIDLHKWSILKEAGSCLIDYGNPRSEAYLNQSDSSQPFQLRWVRQLSTQPLVPITAEQLIDGLKDFTPPNSYIEELLPFVRNFITSHKDHFMFLTCDCGERPWDIGEPKRFEWKEIQAAFNHQGQRLPRNLVEDFGFRHWDEVLEYYSEQQDSYFLIGQLKYDGEGLRQAFEQEVSAIQQNENR